MPGTNQVSSLAAKAQYAHFHYRAYGGLGRGFRTGHEKTTPKDAPQEALEATGGSQGQVREIVWGTYTLTINDLRGKVRQLELRAKGHWSYSPYWRLQKDSRLPPLTAYIHDEKVVKRENGEQTYVTT